MKRYLLAHDLGTLGNKATLFTTEGELVASETSPYSTRYSNENWAEQNPEDRWSAVRETTLSILSEFDKSEIAAVCFSGQMMGCLCVDAASGTNAYDLTKRVWSEEILIGGGAKGTTWRQLLTDVFDLPVLVPQYLEEATSMGAAIIGGVGSGCFGSFDAARQFINIKQRVEPDPERARFYASMKRIFNSCYQALVPVFELVSRNATGYRCVEHSGKQYFNERSDLRCKNPSCLHFCRTSCVLRTGWPLMRREI